jgi:hypothetical protein
VPVGIWIKIHLNPRWNSSFIIQNIVGLGESGRNRGEDEAKGNGGSVFDSGGVMSTTSEVPPPKSTRTNAQRRKGGSSRHVGDILDITSKGCG